MSLFHVYELWVDGADVTPLRVLRQPSRRTALRDAALLTDRLHADPVTATAAVQVTIRRVPGLHPVWVHDVLLVALLGVAMIDPFWPRAILLALLGLALLAVWRWLRRWYAADRQRI